MKLQRARSEPLSSYEVGSYTTMLLSLKKCDMWFLCLQMCFLCTQMALIQPEVVRGSGVHLWEFIVTHSIGSMDPFLYLCTQSGISSYVG